MFRIKPVLFVCAALFVVYVPLASATVTYQVGGCLGSSVTNFTTISAALGDIHLPNVVKVCAGTYPEQLFIRNSVTLEGVSNGNAAQVVITAPPGGLAECGGNVNIVMQVCVINAGTVNITNVIVDGDGIIGSGVYGIYYADTSGTLDHVETRFQRGAGGVGIDLAESANTVTVENSNVHSFNLYGILATDESNSGAEMTVKIEANTIAPDPTAIGGILTGGGASVTISDNIVLGPSKPVSTNFCAGEGGCFGIAVAVPSAGSISGNTVVDVGSYAAGIQLLACLCAASTTFSVTSNTIFDAGGNAIQLSTNNGPPPPLKIEGNIISQALNGIDFGCTIDNNVSSNTISAIHSFALADVPPGVTTSNKYYDVHALSSGC